MERRNKKKWRGGKEGGRGIESWEENLGFRDLGGVEKWMWLEYIVYMY